MTVINNWNAACYLNFLALGAMTVTCITEAGDGLHIIQGGVMRLLPTALAVVLLMLAGVSSTSAAEATIGDEGIGALRSCRLNIEDEARLACFDHTIDKYLSFDFYGNGREHTPSFESPDGFRLGFRSDSVIFVVYVFNADSGELAKTYSSGPGEGEVSVREGGRYYIEVKATDTWKIWVLPLTVSDEQPN
jgi:hypothetical protein